MVGFVEGERCTGAGVVYSVGRGVGVCGHGGVGASSFRVWRTGGDEEEGVSTSCCVTKRKIFCGREVQVDGRTYYCHVEGELEEEEMHYCSSILHILFVSTTLQQHLSTSGYTSKTTALSYSS